MRLTQQEQKILCQEFKKHFAINDELWLFGSRVDVTKKGGDIDLYIKTELDIPSSIKARNKFWTDLQIKLGEQRIDIVVHPQSSTTKLLIHEIVENTGFRIC